MRDVISDATPEHNSAGADHVATKIFVKEAR
jgi:hypothetical protein